LGKPYKKILREQYGYVVWESTMKTRF
jgi:hypothetical protein